MNQLVTNFLIKVVTKQQLILIDGFWMITLGKQNWFKITECLRKIVENILDFVIRTIMCEHIHNHSLVPYLQG